MKLERGSEGEGGESELSGREGVKGREERVS